MPSGSLRDYHKKRDFKLTAEPKGAVAKRKSAAGKIGKLRYLIQKHDATRLHYDFRLEWNGTLMSWAVPKGPSENPDDKRLAVHVEDHPLDYGNFEGTIPKGQYGGGTVMLWDVGHWAPLGDVDESMRKGDLKFAVLGERLKGGFALVRLKNRNNKYGSKGDNWLLIKEKDPYAKPGGKPVTERNLRSAKSGRTMEEISRGNREWHSNRVDEKDPAMKPAKKAAKKVANKSPKKSAKKSAAKPAAKRKSPPRVPAKKKTRRAR